MAWETRKGRGSYYTRSRRVGGRVVREYVGSDSFAEAMAEIDALDRERQNEEQAAMRAEQEAQRMIDLKIDEEGDFVRVLTQAVLLANGYHSHKGQWRKRRDG